VPMKFMPNEKKISHGWVGGKHTEFAPSNLRMNIHPY
jgi:hypothetical protein